MPLEKNPRSPPFFADSISFEYSFAKSSNFLGDLIIFARTDSANFFVFSYVGTHVI